MINRYKYWQWKQPLRLLIRGNGITIWKWCGVFVPLFTVFWGKNHVGYDIFKHGVGIRIHIPKLFILKLAISGYAYEFEKKFVFIKTNC